MNIENIKQLMDDFDLAALFPEIQSILDVVTPTARFVLLLGPFILLGLGLYYFLASPKEANYRRGYRCHWGMGSVAAWQFTQLLAGSLFTIAGLTLVIYMALQGPALAQLEMMDLLLQTMQYLVIQAATVLIVRVLIGLTVVVRYDRKGNRRYSWLELFRG